MICGAGCPPIERLPGCFRILMSQDDLGYDLERYLVAAG